LLRPCRTGARKILPARQDFDLLELLPRGGHRINLPTHLVMFALGLGTGPFRGGNEFFKAWAPPAWRRRRG
jgi:hypothetical protein